MSTNNSVNVSLSGQTGTVNFVGSISPTITTPVISGAILGAGGIQSSTGVNLFSFTYTASAVNYINFINNISSAAPVINAVGTDNNITLNLQGKGTGGAAVQGTSTNDNATAGFVGEFFSSVIAAGSAVTATSNNASNVTSINLTAGDWDVYGNVSLVNGGTSPTFFGWWTSLASATLPDQSLYSANGNTLSIIQTGTGGATPFQRYKLTTTTTIYLSCYLGNTSGNGTACGGIYARRAR